MLSQITYGKQIIWRFIRLVVRQFFANDGIYRASALSFTTLLSLVPLMSVSLTVLSIFPDVEKLQQPLQDFIFSNFVPATGQVVQAYLDNFAKQASQLSLTGLLFLVITAILLIYTIEDAMNQIWRVKVARGGVQAFFLYWAVLTLAPILMVLSLLASSWLLSLPVMSQSIASHSSGYTILLSWMPFLLSVITFTLLYVGIPNRSVRFKHGISGAIFAAALFEMAKSSFTWYITQFNTYELLYGAFAVVPLFFIWIYTAWTIILVGAEFAHALSISHNYRSGERIDGFSHCIQWLGYLYEAQRDGQALSQHQLVLKDTCSYKAAPDDVIAALQENGLIQQTASAKYILACDLSRMSLAELFRRIPWKIPSAKRLQKGPFNTLITTLEQAQDQVLKQPAEHLYDGGQIHHSCP